MQIEEFSTQMNRLINNYGKASYSDERSKLIWREVKALSAKWFENCVDRFISDMKFAPLGNDFRDEIAKERGRQWQFQKKNELAAPLAAKVNPFCPQCKDSGTVLALRKSFCFGLYAFLCDCETARAKRLPYPLWVNAGEEFERYA